uniref:Uncharacterized protein n=1 Tax=Meloidogyne enterolobii TaxID=390850 RepID=A0A6V7VS45_MELEN|nr:unnamed protein product [Meloidogyne enterolobii]
MVFGSLRFFILQEMLPEYFGKLAFCLNNDDWLVLFEVPYMKYRKRFYRGLILEGQKHSSSNIRPI